MNVIQRATSVAKVDIRHPIAADYSQVHHVTGTATSVAANLHAGLHDMVRSHIRVGLKCLVIGN
jgi:hypothetical protein